MTEKTKFNLTITTGALVVLLICIFAWNNPELMNELAKANGEYVSPGVVKKTIDGHEYLQTDKGMLTHSESCPCKVATPTITVVTNVIAVEK